MIKSYLERCLAEWQREGLLDPAVAGRICAYEEAKTGRINWARTLALGFGAVLTGAGILLFVAAHWDRLGPVARFGLVLAMVGVFHLTGLLARTKFAALAITAHGLGTIVLGAGIGLTGQIFNLQEHWPGGIMLWALGAAAGYLLLRDWVQGSLLAVLAPAWLGSEWMEYHRRGHEYPGSAGTILAMGLMLLALVYMGMRRDEADTPLRKAMNWLGALYLIPGAMSLAIGVSPVLFKPEFSFLDFLPGWLGALALAALPGLLAWRGTRLPLLAAALWTGFFPFLDHSRWPLYAWCALGAAGLIAWGLKESRAERINLGIAGFGITVIAFYFSSVMDKLDRSLGLIILGVLFLVTGWGLEKLRRRLNARLAGGVS